MSKFRFYRLVPVVGACAAAAVLAACSGAQPGGSSIIPGAAPQVAAPQVAAPQVAAPQGPGSLGAALNNQHPEASTALFAKTLKSGHVPAANHTSGKSWIHADAKQTLIYASDYPKGTVDIYNYHKPNSLVGQITGFEQPYGQCVDKSGDVYVVDFATADIYEFAHGGTSPIKSAVDNYGYPIGCAVDPKTGNIAVSNFEGYNYSTGGLIIFKGGLNGTQTQYTQGSVYFMWAPGYDKHGNLFVEGYDSYWYYTAIGELPHGGSTIGILAGVSPGFPAGVQGSGTSILAADQGYNGGLTTAIYTVEPMGSTDYVTHTSVLTDDCYSSTDYMDTPQPYTYKGNVIAGNGFCANRFGFWNLANGGIPVRTLPTSIAPSEGYGESVSVP